MGRSAVLTGVRKRCAGASKAVKGHVRAVESLSAARETRRSGDTQGSPTLVENAWESDNGKPVARAAETPAGAPRASWRETNNRRRARTQETPATVAYAGNETKAADAGTAVLNAIIV